MLTHEYRKNLYFYLVANMLSLWCSHWNQTHLFLFPLVPLFQLTDGEDPGFSASALLFILSSQIAREARAPT